MVSWVALSVIFLYLLHLSTMEVKTSQPCRSQVRQPPGLNMLGHCKEAADPRVGSLTTKGPGAVSDLDAAEITGATDSKDTAHSFQRKRAYRRARRRVEINGGTMAGGGQLRSWHRTTATT